MIRTVPDTPSRLTPALVALLAALTIGLLVLPPQPANGQDWEVWGNGDGLTLDQDMDDGLDRDAEMVLSIHWQHIDKERNLLTQLTTTREATHDWNTAGSSLSGLSQNFLTKECDEADYIFVTARLSESDLFGTFEKVLTSVAGIAVRVTVTAVLAPSPIASEVGGIAGSLTKSLLMKFSGVQDLGHIGMKRLELGANDFQLKGPAGSGKIRISDKSFQTLDEFNLECAQGLAKGSLLPQTPLDPTTAVDDIYPPLLDSLALVPMINREDSTGPGADTEIRYLRRSTAATLVGLGELAAVFAVYQAQAGLMGADAALPLLSSARAHQAAGEHELAVIDYREAFRIAYTAIWNGNLGAPYALADHFTLLGSTRLVSPETYHELTGWVQGLGATEFVDAIDVTGQGAGMEFSAVPGVARSGVILVADLLPDYERNDVIGLGRVTAGVVSSPDAGCPTQHLVEGSPGGGIFIDGEGPFFEPEPAGCGYGEVIETYQDIEGGGVPPGAGPDPDGIYTLTLRLTDELEPGEYHLTVTAQIGDTAGPGREISAPLTLLVPEIGALMADAFESGDTSAWSATVQ